jgi:hypothetical protein
MINFTLVKTKSTPASEQERKSRPRSLVGQKVRSSAAHKEVVEICKKYSWVCMINEGVD